MPELKDWPNHRHYIDMRTGMCTLCRLMVRRIETVDLLNRIEETKDETSDGEHP